VSNPSLFGVVGVFGVVCCLPFKRDERLGEEDDEDDDNDNGVLIDGRDRRIHLEKRSKNDGFFAGFASNPADAGSVKFDFAAGFAGTTDLFSDSFSILPVDTQDYKKNLLLRALLCVCVRVALMMMLLLLLSLLLL
jgi:hypothetical protein